jgi:hypothetical protein
MDISFNGFGLLAARLEKQGHDKKIIKISKKKLKVPIRNIKSI